MVIDQGKVVVLKNYYIKIDEVGDYFIEIVIPSVTSIVMNYEEKEDVKTNVEVAIHSVKVKVLDRTLLAYLLLPMNQIIAVLIKIVRKRKMNNEQI